MVAVLRGNRPCRLEGGPFDGWSGEFVETEQRTADFGSGAEAGCYVYRRAGEEGKTVVWRYDKTESTRRLRAAGLLDQPGLAGTLTDTEA